MKRFIILFCQRQIRLWWIGLIILVFLASLSLAEIPKMINYQGMLTEESGDPITDTLDLEFGIYTQETGGTAEWSEAQNQVSIIDGLFNVILGSVDPNGVNLDFSEPYWLEVVVEDDTMPRIQFTSVGYAYRAQRADTADYALGGGGGAGSPWIFRITDGGDTTVTTGGRWGIARYGNTLYGDADSTHVNLGVACVTGGDGQSYKYCTVSGGRVNTAGGQYTTVGGGLNNTAQGDYATVSGGWNNNASNGLATVGGGYGNTANGFRATVAGGSDNAAGSSHGAVGGGFENTAGGVYGGVFSGHSNLAGDEVADTGAFVGGGYGDSATGMFATVSGGRQNNASGDWATIGGGRNNVSNHVSTTVAGGYNNEATYQYAFVGGGQTNTASEQYTTVGGGFHNSAIGRWSTVAGGIWNSAGNQPGDTAAFVGGGSYNAAIAMFGTVCGGYRNYNEGEYSVICGGYKDTLTSGADHSMAFGKGVWVDTSYRVVFFDGDNSGRLGINRDDREDATNGNGAHLTVEGYWNGASSKTFKTDFQSLNGEQILAHISSLPVESWRYKGSQGRHIGPYAEDFAQIFGVGTVREDGEIENKYLASSDVAGVALAGVKELIQQNQELKQTIQELRQMIAELERAK